MLEVQNRKPLKALILRENDFCTDQVQLLETSGFITQNFVIDDVSATGFKQLFGTTYSHGANEVTVVTTVDCALEIACKKPINLIVTGWDFFHPTHNILTRFAEERRILALPESPKTFSLIIGATRPKPFEHAPPQRFIRHPKTRQAPMWN